MNQVKKRHRKKYQAQPTKSRFLRNPLSLSQSSHLQVKESEIQKKYALLSPPLIHMIERLLIKIGKSSEEAVVEITKRVENMNSLGESQRTSLRDALESYYNNDESAHMQKVLNDNVTKMIEATQAGDMEAVNRIASNEDYDKARKSTKNLHDRLQHLIHGDEEFMNQIMPVITALQFHDRIRQELDSLVKSLKDYVVLMAEVNGVNPITDTIQDIHPDVWRKISRNFTNLEAREEVLKAGFGEKYTMDEKDREGLVGNDDFFL